MGAIVHTLYSVYLKFGGRTLYTRLGQKYSSNRETATMRHSMKTLPILYKGPLTPTSWEILKQNQWNQQCLKRHIWKKKLLMKAVDVMWLGKSETLPWDEITQITKIHCTHFGMGLVQVLENHIDMKRTLCEIKSCCHHYESSLFVYGNIWLRCWMSSKSSVYLSFNYISKHWPGLILSITLRPN